MKTVLTTIAAAGVILTVGTWFFLLACVETLLGGKSVLRDSGLDRADD